MEYDIDGEGTNGGVIPLTYTDLCATYNGYCYENEILRLATLMPDIELRKTNLTYPIFFDPNTFQVSGVATNYTAGAQKSYSWGTEIIENSFVLILQLNKPKLGLSYSRLAKLPTRDAGWSQYHIITAVPRIKFCTPPVARVARSQPVALYCSSCKHRGKRDIVLRYVGCSLFILKYVRCSYCSY